MADEVIHQLRHRKPRLGQRPPSAIAARPARRAAVHSTEGPRGIRYKRRQLPLSTLECPPPYRGVSKHAALPPAAPAPVQTFQHRKPRAATVPPPDGKRRRRKTPAAGTSLPRAKRTTPKPLVPITAKTTRRRLPTLDGVLRERRRFAQHLPPIYARGQRRKGYALQHLEPTPNKRKGQPRGVLPPFQGRRLRRDVPQVGPIALPVRRIARQKQVPPLMGERMRRRVPNLGLVAALQAPWRRVYRPQLGPWFVGKVRRSPRVAQKTTTLPPQGKWAKVAKSGQVAQQIGKLSQRRRVPLLALVAVERLPLRRMAAPVMLLASLRRYTRQAIAALPIIPGRPHRLAVVIPPQRGQIRSRRVPYGPYIVPGPYKSVAGQVWTPGNAPGTVIQE